LGDLLLGTLRRELSAEEAGRWPSFAEAKSRVATGVIAPDPIHPLDDGVEREALRPAI
jgi:hypothetical protein